MKRLKAHPAAELFPMLGEGELDELANDIKARGVLHPAVLHEGKILDGRNRDEACRRAGVELPTVEWHTLVPAESSPVAWVLSTNLRRRHLTETQRAVIGRDALPLLEAEAAIRQKATLKRGARSVSAPGREREPSGKTGPFSCQSCGHQVMRWVGKCPECGTWGSMVEGAATAEKKPKGKAAALAAKAVGASTRSVERAKAVLSKRPDLHAQLKDAKLTLKQAEKAIKREEQTKQVLEYRPPAGRYSVIVTDVPWRYDDELNGSDQARGGVQYPTMTVEEICAIKLGEHLAAADCALWFWVTTAFLIDGTAARVLDAWGFTPKALMTWRKVDAKGNVRVGAGRYLRNVTEHCILAIRGKPVVRGERQPNVFDAPRRGHSEKPDEFFKIVETVTPAPAEARLELFARQTRDGWRTSGAELPAVSSPRARRLDAAAAERDLKPENVLLAGGWEPSPTGYAKRIDGLFWCIETVNGRNTWQAYRPKQGEVRARNADNFPTAEAAMEWVESVAPGAAELQPADDGSLCGIRPAKNGDGCIHKQGHKGLHSNGKTTWRDGKHRKLLLTFPDESASA